MRAYCIPNALHIFSHFTFTATLGTEYYYFLFTDEETESERLEQFQSLAAGAWAEPGSISRSSDVGAQIHPSLSLPVNSSQTRTLQGPRLPGLVHGEAEQDGRPKAYVFLGHRPMEESSLTPRETLVRTQGGAAGGVSANLFLLQSRKRRLREVK